jgi:anthranilate phosphoribosyltransferase
MPEKSRLQHLLRTLVQSPETFTAEDAYLAFRDIMSGTASATQIASFLTALRAHRLDHRADFLAACGRVLHEQARQIPLATFSLSPSNIVDIVGTGGDGHNTFNVSTSAGIVASAAGARVAKVSLRLAQRHSLAAHRR